MRFILFNAQKKKQIIAQFCSGDCYSPHDIIRRTVGAEHHLQPNCELLNAVLPPRSLLHPSPNIFGGRGNDKEIRVLRARPSHLHPLNTAIAAAKSTGIRRNVIPSWGAVMKMLTKIKPIN